MTPFESRRLSAEPDAIAPDGSKIRLASVDRAGASMVHCTLGAGEVTRAVSHRTVEEAWLCVAGTGRLWRSKGGKEAVTELSKGVAVSIEQGTRFQFRNDGPSDLEIVIATFPPWPGDDEAEAREGPWRPQI